MNILFKNDNISREYLIKYSIGKIYFSFTLKLNKETF